MANQREHSRLEQKSVINFLVTVKCKPCEIYSRICDVYWEAYFTQRNLNKWAKHRFITKSLSQKMETHWLTGKEKVLGTAVSKDGYSDSVLEH